PGRTPQRSHPAGGGRCGASTPSTAAVDVSVPSSNTLCCGLRHSAVQWRLNSSNGAESCLVLSIIGAPPRLRLVPGIRPSSINRRQHLTSCVSGMLRVLSHCQGPFARSVIAIHTPHLSAG